MAASTLGKPSQSIPITYYVLTLRSHYVAFIRRQLDSNKAKSWVLFNDEKVVEADNVEEVKKFAYVYFLERL